MKTVNEVSIESNYQRKKYKTGFAIMRVGREKNVQNKPEKDLYVFRLCTFLEGRTKYVKLLIA